MISLLSDDLNPPLNIRGHPGSSIRLVQTSFGRLTRILHEFAAHTDFYGGLIWQSSLDDRPQDHSQSMVQGGSFKMCSQISSKAAKDKLYRGSTDQNPIYQIDLKRQFSCLGPDLCNIRVNPVIVFAGRGGAVLQGLS